ncbi:MAG TPA: DUF167 domain-containing protein [Candidatus Kaiserbacteria bacterium]|nr:DUF167 domain-containing protein [Candidatus Kaiserbacteria bacterium]
MYIKVFVTPSARKEKIEEKKDGSLIISVREPASGNHANKRVREIIALREGISIAQVRILTGHHSRAKMISVLSR